MKPFLVLFLTTLFAIPACHRQCIIQTEAETEQPFESENTESRNYDFNDDLNGQLPENFVSTLGQWEVTNEQTLAQLAENTGPTFNTILAENTDFQNLSISVRIRSHAGSIDQGGGLIWRAQDEQNYYVVRYNPLEDNFRLYTVVNGHREMLQDVTVQIDHAAWHTLEVTMLVDHIICSINGEDLIDFHDSTFTQSGRIGLWTKADAQTFFDDLSVSSAE